MLDAFIIEELKRREETRRQRDQRPCIELPCEDGNYENEEEIHCPDYKEGDRGVIVIDFSTE